MKTPAIERMIHLWTRLRTRAYTALLSSQFAQFGAGCSIQPPFRFGGLNQMSLGKRVIIHRDCWIHIPAEARAEGVKLVIGSFSGIGMGATIAAVQQVVIGEHVMLARNVYIADHAHAYSDPALPITDQGIDSIRPVSIGRDSWLGQNSVVLPGVIIGEHCVIGANSVVNRSIPDFSLAVGAPARVVKQYNRTTGKWEKPL